MLFIYRGYVTHLSLDTTQNLFFCFLCHTQLIVLVHLHRLSIAGAQKKRDASYALNFGACVGKETPVGLTECTTPIGANALLSQGGMGMPLSSTRNLYYFRALLFQIVSYAFWFNAK